MPGTAGGPQPRDLWLFGYGSLIWKPPPHYDLRVPGFIRGYVRRFWQASEDHRGTSEAPGRVVTLIERSYWSKLGELVHTPEPDKVFGTAYRIPHPYVEEVTKYLDIREINGYSIQYTKFFPSGSDPSESTKSEAVDGISPDLPQDQVLAPISKCLVYIGLPTNPQFLGLQVPADVAGTISISEGFSGRNDEYLFMLEAALDELHVNGELDMHVKELACRVRELQLRRKEATGPDHRARSRAVVQGFGHSGNSAAACATAT